MWLGFHISRMIKMLSKSTIKCAKGDIGYKSRFSRRSEQTKKTSECGKRWTTLMKLLGVQTQIQLQV